MNLKEAIRKKWPSVRSKLKFENPELELTDLQFEIGHEEELLERITKKTGKSKQEVITDINAQLLEV